MSTPSSLRLTLVPGAERLVQLHEAELPQKNELCGAFWGTLALRLAGVAGDDAQPVDQDAVGSLAGSMLSSRPDEDLPPGETGRADYRVSFPTADDPARSGTSADGLVRALGDLAGEALALVPVCGPWTPAAVTTVLDGATACATPCTVIANLATRHLWGGHPSPEAVIAYLMSGDPDAGPEADWDVGHFVGLLGRIEGPRGTLVLVGDTYRSLGWEGIHVQPIECVSDALARVGSPQPSGVILAAAPGETPELERRIRGAGLTIGTWDNGSLDILAAGR